MILEILWVVLSIVATWALNTFVLNPALRAVHVAADLEATKLGYVSSAHRRAYLHDPHFTPDPMPIPLARVVKGRKR